MTRVTSQDFAKLLEFLKKNQMDGAILTFREEGTKLVVTTIDVQAKEVRVELSDTQYPFKPTVTRTETL